MTVALRRARGIRSFNVPAGSLANYYAALANHATQRVEIVVQGDSTFAGQVSVDSAGTHYSPATRLRALLLAAGYTDGGHGWNNGPADTPHVSGEVASGVSAQTGFAASDAFGMAGEVLSSATAADTVTFQGYGTHIRIWYRRYSFGGRFTYSVDGGAAVTVDPPFQNAGSVSSFHFFDVPGLSEALHTVQVVNSGGRAIDPPAFNVSASNASNASFQTTPGTWYYKVTGVTAAGETLPSAAGGPVTVSAPSGGVFTGANGNGAGGVITNVGGCTSYNVYRSATLGGTYQLVATIATAGGSFTGWSDQSNGAAPGATAPTVSTAGLNSSNKNVQVVPEFFRDAGVIIHNQACRAVQGTYTDASERALEQLFGLTQDTNPVTGAAALQPLDPSTNARRVCLAIHSTGINDQQGNGTTDTSATTFTGCVNFIRAAKKGGASVLVCIPALTSANQKQKAGMYRQALVDAADQEGVAWVDLGIGGAFEGVTFGGTDPHLSEAQYITQGNYIWNKALNPALAYA